MSKKTDKKAKESAIHKENGEAIDNKKSVGMEFPIGFDLPVFKLDLNLKEFELLDDLTLDFEDMELLDDLELDFNSFEF